MYSVDLDADPMTRYSEITKDFASELSATFVYIRASYLGSVGCFALDYILTPIYPLIELIWVPRELALEIRGIAKGVPSVTPAELFLLNMAYEIMSACTSIVALGPHGETYLGRNLDLDFVDYVRKLNIRIIYKRGSVELAECAAVAGCLGSFTCVKKGEFAVSLNNRPGNGTVWSYIKTAVNALSARWSTTWMVREVVLQARNYDELVGLLQTSKTITASFLIVAGHRAGAVITRGADGAVDTVTLNETTTDWFLVQCNVDRWATQDERTLTASLRMTSIGREDVSLERIAFDNLLVPPVLRQNWTAATVLMEVGGYMHVVVPT